MTHIEIVAQISEQDNEKMSKDRILRGMSHVRWILRMELADKRGFGVVFPHDVPGFPAVELEFGAAEFGQQRV